MLIAITVNFRNSKEKRQIHNETFHFLVAWLYPRDNFTFVEHKKRAGNKKVENDRKSLMTNLMMAEMKVWQVKKRREMLSYKYMCALSFLLLLG